MGFSSRIVLAIAVAALATPPAASQVDDIVAKHIAARGGAERLAAMRSLRASGSMRLRAVEAPFTLWMSRPDRARVEIALPGMRLVQAYDGDTAWWINPLAGAREPRAMPGDFQRIIERWVDFEGPLVDYEKKGHTVTYTGEGMSATGATVHLLEIAFANGDRWRVGIDAASYQEVERSYEQEVGGKKGRATFRFDDFMTVDGVTLPGRIAGSLPGGGMYTMTFDGFTLNDGVAASMFTMPAAETEPLPPGIVGLSGLGPLRERFNGDTGAVRAVILLSPN